MLYKNIEIVNVMNFLDSFLEVKLPSKISFAIIKNRNYFEKEYQDYLKTLEKTYSIYVNDFEKDKEGKVITSDNGIPIIKDSKINDKLQQEIIDLLSLEVNVERFYIDENIFDNYDDEKYDILTPKRMYELMEFLCDGNDSK